MDETKKRLVAGRELAWGESEDAVHLVGPVRLVSAYRMFPTPYVRYTLGDGESLLASPQLLLALLMLGNVKK
jgi:hypothetical protein